MIAPADTLTPEPAPAPDRKDVRPCRGRRDGRHCERPPVRFLTGPSGVRSFYCSECTPAHVVNAERLQWLPGCEPDEAAPDPLDLLLQELGNTLRGMHAERAELNSGRVDELERELHDARNQLTALRLQEDELQNEQQRLRRELDVVRAELVLARRDAEEYRSMAAEAVELVGAASATQAPAERPSERLALTPENS
jgi:hypothetical protein